MKNIFTFFLLSLFLGQNLIYAQVESIQLSVDKSGYLENQENQTGTQGGGETSTDLIPTIKGELNVNAQGALTYSIPIEVIKGVNEFQPNLALAYSSDAGNGQAGYGWNIVGLSSITRGGKSKKIDDVYEGPQFDEKDPYYLDGQRLIGFNEETPNIAVTEIYSTIKVSKTQETNYKFKVQYPDGKVAKYMKVSPWRYSIGLIIDSYGNEIKYNYVAENNTTYLTSIEYGKTTESHPFIISFERVLKKQAIKAYRNGSEIINNKVLKSVSVSSTQEGLYRKYILTHDISSLGQERLRIVDVENKKGERLKSLNFKYSDKSNYTVEQKLKGNSGITKLTEQLGSVAMGDFEGDGEVSAVYILKENNEQKLVSSKRGFLSSFPKDSIPTFYSGKIINSEGKVSERDQLISIEPINKKILSINGKYAIERTIRIKYQDLLSKELGFFDFNIKLGFIEKSTACSNVAGQGDDAPEYIETEFSEILNKSIVGDFNNDGLLDLLLIVPEQYSLNKLVGSLCGLSYEEQSEYYLTQFKQKSYYLIEIGREINSKKPFDIATKEYQSLGMSSEKEHHILEFNGDGMPEILQLDKKTKKIDVLRFNHKNKSIDTVLSKFELSDFTDETPLIIGDFNGDGLMDFITPQRTFKLTKNNGIKKLAPQIEKSNHIWWQYLSDGKTFIKTKRDFTEQGLAHCVPSARDYAKGLDSFWKKLWSGPTLEYDYSEYGACVIIPIDFNNDGKTDIATFKKFGKIKFEKKIAQSHPQNVNIVTETTEEMDEECYNACMQGCENEGGSGCSKFCSDECSRVESVETKIVNKLMFHENIYDKDQGFTFKSHKNTNIDLGNKVISPFSFFINSQQNKGLDTYNTKLVLHDPHQNKDHIYSIESKEFFENRIKEVDNNSGVIQQVEYIPLQKNKDCNYSYKPQSLNLPYPYFIHKQVPAKFMVNKVSTLFDGKSVTKEYRYENAVQHLDGKGFMGFAKTYVSDPYESKFTKNTYLPKNLNKPLFWQISIHDPKQENQLVEARYGELNGDYFTKSNISYQKFIKDTHRYLYHTKKELNHDRIKNITITKTHNYDTAGDLLILSTNTNFNNQGNTTTQFVYKPAWSIGERYYNGKILSVVETISAYGSTFTTKNEYNNFNAAGMPLEHKKYGNNTDPIVSTISYDNYGNKKSETISARGVEPLKSTFSYDTTKRFLVSATNPEGQTATKTVDIHGKPLSETSALGLTTTHTYDSWGNPLSSTNPLGVTTKLEKKKLSNGQYTLSTTTPGEPKTIVTFDKFDREIKAKTQSINNKWVIVDTEYDIYGKELRVSQPYFENESPTLWNSTEYDDLNRPVKQTLYTGKIVTTCYNGMQVTVDDGDQKHSKTLDVFGNVVKHKDFGGEISYNYYPNGTLKEANYDGIIIKVEQDGWGNKTKLEDPSAGIYEYRYDALGRKLEEKTPKGKTTYTYDTFGKILYEVEEGDNTSLSLQYEYDPTTKLPTKIYSHNGTDNFIYETHYDNYYRIKGKTEKTPFFTYKTNTTFDNYGRPEVVETETKLADGTRKVFTKVKNIYDANGLQTKLINPNTKQTLWQINKVNAKGQLLQMQYGNAYQINQGFDNYFMPQSISHNKGNKTALSIDYQFNAKKAILLSRSNHTFGKHENFEHDKLRRLTKEILNGKTVNQYAYDKRGRITQNTELGKYHYAHNNYKINKIGFNNKGNLLEQNRGFHNITYNSYKKAVEIELPAKEKIGFDYNPFRDRVAMYYGSEHTDKKLRPLRKYYSSDKAVEIKHNLQTGEIEVLSYLDGNPYTANVIQRNIFTKENIDYLPDLWYLHRDYQATILAITNQAGDILEQRYFDAWGNLKEYQDDKGIRHQVSNSTAITLIFDRGYTGHEHLWGVDLVHMNGRLYDAKLRRFLSPDNFIQDPYNTQNFNRYGYVLNNPLIYTDPSGEIGFFAVVAIGAAIGITTKIIANIVSGQKWWYGIGKAGVIGAISGAISFGIGTVATSVSGSFVGQSAFQAGAHGITGGFMSVLDGGGFGSGFWSGMVSSVISSGVKALGTNFKLGRVKGKLLPNNFGKSDYFKATMIAGGGLSGGISSSISGGGFWQGVRQGLITSGLNHAAHEIVKGDPGDPPSKYAPPTNKDITPWEVGWEWLTGQGPRHRNFTNGDYFTELLRTHEHILDTKSLILEQILNGAEVGSKGVANYNLGGIGGVGKYMKDYSTLTTGGLTGNIGVTYLGSYSLKWEVMEIRAMTAKVVFTVHNSSTIQSATRPPVIGYQSWWKNSVGKWIGNTIKSGPMSTITQTFRWVENLSW